MPARQSLWDTPQKNKPKSKKRAPLLGSIAQVYNNPGTHGVAKYMNKWSKGASESITGFPSGMKLLGTAFAHDISTPGALRPGGKPSHLLPIGKAMGSQFKTNVLHPGRDPFGSSMLLLALASAGSGTGARALSGIRAAKAGENIGRAVTRRPVYTRMIKGSQVAPHVSKGESSGVKTAKSMADYGKKPKKIENPLHQQLGLDFKTSQKSRTSDPLQAPFKDLASKAGEHKISLSKEFKYGTRTKSRTELKADLRKNIPLPGMESASRSEPLAVRASPNPLARLVIKGASAAADRISPGLSAERELARRSRDIRHVENPAVQQHLRPTGHNVVGTVLRSPMAAVRGSMYLNPRTGIQNAIQSATMLAHQQPLGIFKSVHDLRGLRKNDPEALALLKRVGGSTQTRAALEGGVAGPMTSRIINKLADIQSWPEQNLRPLSHLYEARQRGVPATELKNVLNDPHSNLFHQIVRPGSKQVGDFGNLSTAESKFMASQIPIFYPMFKALAEYGGKFPLEHSIQSSLGANLGKQGKKYQKDYLGDLPFWDQFAIPIGKKGSNRQLNPSNLYNFQVIHDLVSQAIHPARAGGGGAINLFAEAAPAVSLIHAGLTGRDLQTGYPLRSLYKKDSKGKYLRKNGKKVPAAGGSYLAALKDFGMNLSPATYGRAALGQPQLTKSFEPPGGRPEALLLQALGAGMVPRTGKPKELLKQARHENPNARGPTPVKKTPSGSRRRTLW